MWRRLTAIAVVLVFSPVTRAGRPAWERELRELGYLFLHISNINIVNGLYLTREQATGLRQLAREVESVSERPPTLRAPMSDDLESVRRPWLELRELLLAGKEIPGSLEHRVSTARVHETEVLRKGILSSPSAFTTRCASCHSSPIQEWPGRKREPMTVTPRLKPLVTLAHVEGVFGKRGMVKLSQVSPKVEEILTNTQQATLSRFTCCLVPPQDLRDPVRVGQAETSQKAIDMLRKIRRCPDGLWPEMREALLQRIEGITGTVSPGVTQERKSRARDGVAEALDRARTLSEPEFELAKDELSKAVKVAIVPEPMDSPHKAAYFLMIPGASKVYSAYLKRMPSE